MGLAEIRGGYVPESEGVGLAIDQLRVLVHPLFIPDFGVSTPRMNDEYRNGRQFLYDNALERFIPQSSTDVTLLMPAIGHTVGELRKEAKGLREIRRRSPELVNWDRLYEAMKQKSGVGNVALARNIVNIGSITELQEDLLKRGFVLTGETDITLGGEWLCCCVDAVVGRILASDQVNRIRLDKRVLLNFSRGEYGPWKPALEEGIQRFMNSYRMKPFRVNEDDDFIRLAKR